MPGQTLVRAPGQGVQQAFLQWTIATGMSYFDGAPIRIGISACLLGQRVRYDGDHKRNNWLVDELGPEVTWVPVCPEVELGLGVPRETIELVRLGEGRIRLIASQTGRDLTDDMARYAAERVAALADEDLSAYVLKTKSPSCGLTQVKIVARSNDLEPLSRDGRGLFAVALQARWPGFPVMEEHQLETAHGRAQLVDRVRRYRAER